MNLAALAEDRPEFVTAWSDPGFRVERPHSFADAAPRHLVPLCLHVLKTNRIADHFVTDLLGALTEVLGFGFVSFLCSHASETPPAGRREVPQPLYGPKGRRRRVPPLELEDAMCRAKRIGIGNTQALDGIVSERGWDVLLRTTHNRLLHDKMAGAFRDSLHLGISWDAGSYGGHQCNVGCVVCLRSASVGYLTPKA